MQLIRQTRSICGKCKKITDADIVEENGKVFMIKKCCSRKTLVENDVKIYKYLISTLCKKNFDPKYLVFPLTNRCNLNCPRCYEKSTKWGRDLSMEEIDKVLKQFNGKWVMISGGEPTLREDLGDIIKLINSYNFVPVLTTNGIRLTDFNYVLKLKECGLKFVILAFDSVDDDNVYKITHGIGCLDAKLKALENLKKAGTIVILNVTIVPGVNENEIGKIIDFVAKNSDFIKDIRIRTQTRWGRYIKTKKDKYTISELLGFLSKYSRIEWEDIKAELEIRRRFFKKGALSLPCTIHFILKIVNNHALPLGKFLRKKTPLHLIRVLGLKNLFLLLLNGFNLEKTILKSNDFIYLSINVWQDESDIDLNIIEGCPTAYSRGEDILPSCLSLCMRNLKMEGKDVLKEDNYAVD